MELGDHITHLSKSIELENRIKNISKSLENVNLKNSRNSVIYLQNQRQRNEHKIKLISNQLENMKQREIEIKKTLLQHTAGVLSKGIQHLELNQNQHTSSFNELDQVSRRISYICTHKLKIVPVNSNLSTLQKLLQLQDHLSAKSPKRYLETILILLICKLTCLSLSLYSQLLNKHDLYTMQQNKLQLLSTEVEKDRLLSKLVHMELLSTKLLSLISLYPQRQMAIKMELLQYKSEAIELQILEKKRQRDEHDEKTPEPVNLEDPALKSQYEKQLSDQAQHYENDIHQQAILLQRNTRMHQQLETECAQLRSQNLSLDTLVKEKSRTIDEYDNKISRLNYDIRDQQKRATTPNLNRSPSPFSNNREFEAEKNRLKRDFQVREDQWTFHTHQMEDQFDELLDNFDKLTNSAIEFDSHRMRYDKRLDTLNRQRNQLEVELIEEKVKKIGYGQQGELAPTTQALRKEFRLLVADIKKTHQQRLDQEAEEVRRLQMQLEELQKDTNNSHYKYQHSIATQT